MSLSLRNAVRSATPAGRSSEERAVIDISAVNPGRMREPDLASATTELNVVLGETASATSAILEATERIRAIAATLPGKLGAVLTAEVIHILEACTFEGLIGLRLANVIRLLGEVQRDASGSEMECVSSTLVPRAGNVGLLGGRQLPSVAWTQADIDAILEGVTSSRSRVNEGSPRDDPFHERPE